MTREQRFFNKVFVADGHWLWCGYIMPNGYGQFSDGGGTVLAHRWAYEQFVAPVPEGLDLDHLCRIRNCVNPQHLEPVTRSTNLIRGARKTGQHYCKNGHELVGDNLKPTSDGRRQCRECARQAQRRYRATRIQRMETQPDTQKETAP